MKWKNNLLWIFLNFLFVLRVFVDNLLRFWICERHTLHSVERLSLWSSRLKIFYFSFNIYFKMTSAGIEVSQLTIGASFSERTIHKISMKRRCHWNISAIVPRQALNTNLLKDCLSKKVFCYVIQKWAMKCTYYFNIQHPNYSKQWYPYNISATSLKPISNLPEMILQSKNFC